MPLPLIIGGVAVVLLGVVGISVFNWRVYARAGVGPAAVEVGVGGPQSGQPVGGVGSVPWGWIVAGGVGLVVLAKVL